MVNFDTVMIMDWQSILIYSVFFCGVIIGTFIIGFIIGENVERVRHE